VSDLGDEYTESEARVSRIFDRLNQRIGAIIMGAADKAVRDSTAQLQKAKAEIDAEVSKLQESGVSDEALAGLKSVSQSLDDVNPDAPADEAPGDAVTNDGGNTDTATDTSE
jgi:F0F1-type ATP synthase membrane subunit b/b'